MQRDGKDRNIVGKRHTLVAFTRKRRKRERERKRDEEEEALGELETGRKKERDERSKEYAKKRRGKRECGGRGKQKLSRSSSHTKPEEPDEE